MYVITFLTYDQPNIFDQNDEKKNFIQQKFFYLEILKNFFSAPPPL